jgi:hypothetical protein
MRAGPTPRVKACQPSFRSVLVITFHVEEYFWPSALVKPSVCIRDFTVSSGYIAGQICTLKVSGELQGVYSQSTDRVSGCGTEKDGLAQADLISSDPFLPYLTLHQRLVREEV